MGDMMDDEDEKKAQELKALGCCPSIFVARKAVYQGKYEKYRDIAIKNRLEMASKNEKPGTTTWPCPKCKGMLIRRKNKLTKEIFLACDSYPLCRYTQKVEKSDDSVGIADAASVWE